MSTAAVGVVLATWLLLLQPMSASAADARANATAASSQPSGCTFAARELPSDMIVIAAGSYAGRPAGFQIDQSGHEATLFEVGVHAEKPVGLLLGSYDPAIWSIRWSEGTRIVAVFVSGYHRQRVAGLPKGVPLIVSTYDDNGPCGYNYFSDESGLGWINPKARTIFGTSATRVYNKAPDGRIDIIESTRPRAAYISSSDTPVASFRDAKAPPAGIAGLREGVVKGLLRPVTAADVEMVRKHYQAIADRTVNRDVPPIAGASGGRPDVKIPWIQTDRAFVVLKPFVYPAGLYGGDLATFVIPIGAPAPTGNPGHSTVINLNRNPPCSGALCR
jgi:hypothetical protein